jgi:5-carboxymethyl-2-hydroxymuconate isomerase
MKTVRISETDIEYNVGKILCIGRNYVDHIKELGNDAPERPVVFMKPSSCIIKAGEQIVIPSYSSDCHHEAELAVLIGREGKDILAAHADDYIAGYGVAIDLTLRDVQNELKKKGLPWDIAKGFDTACPLSEFVSSNKVVDPQDLQIKLSVNGTTRQDASTALMINTVSSLIGYLSTVFTLEPGDIILTGTPAGVGPISSGDQLVAEISGVAAISVSVK